MKANRNGMAEGIAVGHGHQKEAVFHLKRDMLNEDSTLGAMLTPDDNRFGWTLEDEVRPYGEKVWGETAIPATEGDFSYKIDLHYSQKYKHVVVIYTRKVEHDGWTEYFLEYGGISFSMIYVHGGNDDEDTNGCVLLSRNRNSKAETIQGTLKKEFYTEVKKWKDKGYDTRLRVTNPMVG